MSLYRRRGLVTRISFVSSYGRRYLRTCVSFVSCYAFHISYDSCICVSQILHAHVQNRSSPHRLHAQEAIFHRFKNFKIQHHNSSYNISQVTRTSQVIQSSSSKTSSKTITSRTSKTTSKDNIDI
ncbi:hypothetical protein GQ55_8G068300 [Panicum hallii var. hallii]|uniref:Uncharacterized protein n=1 Tax=Panicum hallii var. hallii TaxID=1504633 RepID=A0A2T7CLH2_9POAL|nr:hypothetical protein GQ55_8G068300 [Panicum hallii var. hallii]